MLLCVKVSLLLLLASFATCSAEVLASSSTQSAQVKCTELQMRVEVPLTEKTQRVYLAGLRDYPDPACRPHTDPTGTMAVFDLDLTDVYRCAVTRVSNKQTGKQVYYQTVIVESSGTADEKDQEMRQTLQVKCSMMAGNHTVSKRDVLLPTGFEEVKELKYQGTISSKAPEPILMVGVRQAGKLVTGELNVSPGTPLQMEIFLDNDSSPVYGILVTHMQVTDTKSQEETIIYNGCSVDPYLFENFNTVDGDFLTAKFRAFKFPESTYVQFKGTVNVCLDKCKGVECSDGQIGYGRRRRALPDLPADPNKVFEITITSIIKVDYENDTAALDAGTTNDISGRKLIVGNQRTDDKAALPAVHQPPKVFREERVAVLMAKSEAGSACAVAALVLTISAVVRLSL